MSLKLLAALVVLVVFGVLSSVHGFVAADQKLYAEPASPTGDGAVAPGAKACTLGACADALQPVEAAREPRRSPRRSAFQLRRRIASAWEAVPECSTAPSGS